MPADQFVTGEAVALDLRRAGLPSRLLAGGIDAAIQAVLLFGLLALALAGGGATSLDGLDALVVIVVIVVLAGYPIACESLWRGRTPGKAAMGLRVVRDDGGPVGFRQALVRGLAGLFVERPGVTLFTGAVFCMLLNSHSKRLGDLLAGTVVLQERVAVRSGQAAAIPAPLQAWAAELDLAGLPDGLAVSARSYLARWPQLTVTARTELGNRLAGAITAVVSPPPPPGTPAWAYLAAVLGERRRRAELSLGRPTPMPTPPPSGRGQAVRATPPRNAGEVPVSSVPVSSVPVLPQPPPASTTGFVAPS